MAFGIVGSVAGCSAEGGQASDRPRERLDRLGAAALADAEILALILRTGSRRQDAWSVARELLKTFGGLDSLLSASGTAIEAVPGVGPAKAASLRGAVELAHRLGGQSLKRGEAFRGPSDVQAHFRSRLRHFCREAFHVVLLDGRSRLISVEEVSVGTLTASLVHPREVFREAIRAAAGSLLLVHNHPSGDPSPSAEDRVVTTRLRSAGELVGIPVVDHVIVSEGGHFSFREAREPSLCGPLGEF
ncbi:MAG: DNA repair protein RadC [Myxococcota bacterium]